MLRRRASLTASFALQGDKISGKVSSLIVFTLSFWKTSPTTVVDELCMQAKETFGNVTGDDSKKAEGQTQNIGGKVYS